MLLRWLQSEHNDILSEKVEASSLRPPAARTSTYENGMGAYPEVSRPPQDIYARAVADGVLFAKIIAYIDRDSIDPSRIHHAIPRHVRDLYAQSTPLPTASSAESAHVREAPLTSIYQHNTRLVGEAIKRIFENIWASSEAANPGMYEAENMMDKKGTLVQMIRAAKTSSPIKPDGLYAAIRLGELVLAAACLGPRMKRYLWGVHALESSELRAAILRSIFKTDHVFGLGRQNLLERSQGDLGGLGMGPTTGPLTIPEGTSVEDALRERDEVVAAQQAANETASNRSTVSWALETASDATSLAARSSVSGTASSSARRGDGSGGSPGDSGGGAAALAFQQNPESDRVTSPAMHPEPVPVSDNHADPSGSSTFQVPVQAASDQALLHESSNLGGSADQPVGSHGYGEHEDTARAGDDTLASGLSDEPSKAESPAVLDPVSVDDPLRRSGLSEREEDYILASRNGTEMPVKVPVTPTTPGAGDESRTADFAAALGSASAGVVGTEPAAGPSNVDENAHQTDEGKSTEPSVSSSRMTSSMVAIGRDRLRSHVDVPTDPPTPGAHAQGVTMGDRKFSLVTNEETGRTPVTSPMYVDQQETRGTDIDGLFQDMDRVPIQRVDDVHVRGSDSSTQDLAVEYAAASLEPDATGSRDATSDAVQLPNEDSEPPVYPASSVPQVEERSTPGRHEVARFQAEFRDNTVRIDEVRRAQQVLDSIQRQSLSEADDGGPTTTADAQGPDRDFVQAGSYERTLARAARGQPQGLVRPPHASADARTTARNGPAAGPSAGDPALARRPQRAGGVTRASSAPPGLIRLRRPHRNQGMSGHAPPYGSSRRPMSWTSGPTSGLSGPPPPQHGYDQFGLPTMPHAYGPRLSGYGPGPRPYGHGLGEHGYEVMRFDPYHDGFGGVPPEQIRFTRPPPWSQPGNFGAMRNPLEGHQQPDSPGAAWRDGADGSNSDGSQAPAWLRSPTIGSPSPASSARGEPTAEADNGYAREDASAPAERTGGERLPRRRSSTRDQIFVRPPHAHYDPYDGFAVHPSMLDSMHPFQVGGPEQDFPSSAFEEMYYGYPDTGMVIDDMGYRGGPAGPRGQAAGPGPWESRTDPRLRDHHGMGDPVHHDGAGGHAGHAEFPAGDYPYAVDNGHGRDGSYSHRTRMPPARPGPAALTSRATPEEYTPRRESGPGPAADTAPTEVQERVEESDTQDFKKTSVPAHVAGTSGEGENEDVMRDADHDKDDAETPPLGVDAAAKLEGHDTADAVTTHPGDAGDSGQAGDIPTSAHDTVGAEATPTDDVVEKSASNESLSAPSPEAVNAEKASDDIHAAVKELSPVETTPREASDVDAASNEESRIAPDTRVMESATVVTDADDSSDDLENVRKEDVPSAVELASSPAYDETAGGADDVRAADVQDSGEDQAPDEAKVTTLMDEQAVAATEDVPSAASSPGLENEGEPESPDLASSPAQEADVGLVNKGLGAEASGVADEHTAPDTADVDPSPIEEERAADDGEGPGTGSQDNVSDEGPGSLDLASSPMEEGASDRVAEVLAAERQASADAETATAPAESAPVDSKEASSTGDASDGAESSGLTHKWSTEGNRIAQTGVMDEEVLTEARVSSEDGDPSMTDAEASTVILASSFTGSVPEVRSTGRFDEESPAGVEEGLSESLAGASVSETAAPETSEMPPGDENRAQDALHDYGNDKHDKLGDGLDMGDAVREYDNETETLDPAQPDFADDLLDAGTAKEEDGAIDDDANGAATDDGVTECAQGIDAPAGPDVTEFQDGADEKTDVVAGPDAETNSARSFAALLSRFERNTTGDHEDERDDDHAVGQIVPGEVDIPADEDRPAEDSRQDDDDLISEGATDPEMTRAVEEEVRGESEPDVAGAALGESDDAIPSAEQRTIRESATSTDGMPTLPDAAAGVAGLRSSERVAENSTRDESTGVSETIASVESQRPSPSRPPRPESIGSPRVPGTPRSVSSVPRAGVPTSFHYRSPPAPYAGDPFRRSPGTPRTPPHIDTLLPPLNGVDGLEDMAPLPRPVSTMEPSPELSMLIGDLQPRATGSESVDARSGASAHSASGENTSRRHRRNRAGMRLSQEEASMALSGQGDNTDGGPGSAAEVQSTRTRASMRSESGTSWQEDPEAPVDISEWDDMLGADRRPEGEQRHREANADRALPDDALDGSQQNPYAVGARGSGGTTASISLQSMDDGLPPYSGERASESALLGPRIRIDRSRLDWLTQEVLAARDMIHERDMELNLREQAQADEREVLLLERRDAEAVVQTMRRLLEEREAELHEARNRLAETIEAASVQAEEHDRATALAQANAEAEEQHLAEERARELAHGGPSIAPPPQDQDDVMSQSRLTARVHEEMSRMWEHVRADIEQQVFQVVERRDHELEELRAELRRREAAVEELEQRNLELSAQATDAQTAAVQARSAAEIAHRDTQLVEARANAEAAQRQGQVECVSQFAQKLEDVFRETEHLRAEVAESQARMAAIASSTGVTSREARELRDALSHAQSETERYRTLADRARERQMLAEHNADELRRLLDGARTNEGRQDAARFEYSESEDAADAAVYQRPSTGRADDGTAVAHRRSSTDNGLVILAPGPSRWDQLREVVHGVVHGLPPLANGRRGRHQQPHRQGGQRTRRHGGEQRHGHHRRYAEENGPRGEPAERSHARVPRHAPTGRHSPRSEEGAWGTHDARVAAAAASRSGSSDGGVGDADGRPQMGYAEQHGYVAYGQNETRVGDFY